MDFIRNNWLSILIYAAFIYMMFRRGGCCGGHSHAGHNHTGENSTVEMVQDPVCGMYVNPDKAIKGYYNGKTYYFCSDSCKSSYERENGY